AVVGGLAAGTSAAAAEGAAGTAAAGARRAGDFAQGPTAEATARGRAAPAPGVCCAVPDEIPPALLPPFFGNGGGAAPRGVAAGPATDGFAPPPTG
ncbi:MAG TPA: hypothetical protein VMF30_10105, partial [Pirellulales bacterium]|nr:hypothetical protein [Pirellulales bacterium]